MAAKAMSIEEFHCRMGHILPEVMRHLVFEGAIKGIEIDKLTQLQSCNSWEYAKATGKPIRMVHKMLHATEFGKEINLDLWGPSPVQTPG
jgi:hypothetical protein